MTAKRDRVIVETFEIQTPEGHLWASELYSRKLLLRVYNSVAGGSFLALGRQDAERLREFVDAYLEEAPDS